MNKREFLKTVAGAGAWTRYAAMPSAQLAQEEAFWASIRGRFRVTDEYVNLENGYYLMQSEPVLEAYIRHVRDVNLSASRYMRTRAAPDKLAVRRRLAELAGCPAEELIITRNTTESLDTVIGGFPWRAGDEAIFADTDYGAMQDMFRLQARRHGIVNRVLTLPLHPRSDEEIVSLYESAVTDRTRLIMVCHVVNLTGHILPVRSICDMARRRGVQVMVDGAHAFAQLDFRIPDLGGDYYGASLHKWLGAPLGSGLLYVRRDRVAGLWPMFAENASVRDDDIMKLNHTGTHPPHTDLAINDAIDFHAMIGVQRKEARLRYLQRYWTDQVRGVAGITLNTPADPQRSCAIANVRVDRMTPGELARTLFERHRIWTVAINRPPVMGVRVTPHLFTTTQELDSLVAALRSLV